MKRLLLCLCLSSPAFADGGVTVRLPDDAAITKAASPALLTDLVEANVVGMNCADYTLSDGEWALITGTADKVAAALGIDTGTYDDQYYGPAFASLDQADTCATQGPKIAPLIERLKSMGGSTDPLG